MERPKIEYIENTEKTNRQNTLKTHSKYRAPPDGPNRPLHSKENIWRYLLRLYRKNIDRILQ